MSGPIGLVPVRIMGLPLDVYRRASEHNDELLREFALVRGDSTDHVPARLLALIDELSTRFGAFTEGPAAALQDALDRGDKQIDLVYEVPPWSPMPRSGWGRSSTKPTTSAAPGTS